MKVNVLDGIGYVEDIDVLGNDWKIANTARMAYNSENKSDKVGDSDEKLIKYLVKHNHRSPFRQSAISFEIKMPLMVKNQMWRHIIGASHIDSQFGYIERSFRYTEATTDDFYIPIWRDTQDKTVLDDTLVVALDEAMADIINHSIRLYRKAVEAGIRKELARSFLPAYLLYTKVHVTMSIDALMNFFDLRLDNHAQFEIRAYADAMLQIFKELFPVTSEIYLKTKVNRGG